MTKKHFIKQLRSYGLPRDQISTIVTYIAKKQGKLSYTKVMEEITTCIYKRLVKELCAQGPPITFCSPTEYTEYNFSDFKMLGVDLALRYDSVVVTPPNCIVVRSVN
jgi:uncharacterized protein YpiB (UPF0302 family)